MIMCFMYELYIILPSLLKGHSTVPLVMLTGLVCVHCASTFSDNGIEQEINVLFILCLASTLLLCYYGYYGSGKQSYSRGHLLALTLVIAYAARRQTKRVSSLLITIGCLASICCILALVGHCREYYTRNYPNLVNSALFGLTQVLHGVIIVYSYCTGNSLLYVPRLVVGCNSLGLLLSILSIDIMSPSTSSAYLILHFYSLVTLVSQPLDIIVANLVYWYVLSSCRYLNSTKCAHYSVCYCLQILLFSRLLYFLTNHQHSFSALQLEVGFVGANQFNFLYAGLLLAVNTFGYDVLALLWLAYSRYHLEGRSRLMLHVAGVVRLCSALCSCLCVLLLNRHLRLWAVYGPKAVFETIFYIINCVILLTYD